MSVGDRLSTAVCILLSLYIGWKAHDLTDGLRAAREAMRKARDDERDAS